MIVTDLQYHLETRLVEKLDLMIRRCTNPSTRKDAVLINEGQEGEGKTNSACAEAYYVHNATQRNIYMFFRLDALIEFAKNHVECIIIWDEPALDALSSDWYKGINKDLIRLLMTCRKNRHFFIFNFTKFFKFNEYIVVDRALGLIHIYSRNDTEPGRFQYIRKRHLEDLYNDYRKYKKRNYKRYKSFNGAFPNIEKYFDRMHICVNGKENATYAEYELEKDKAIRSIGETQRNQGHDSRELRKLKYNIGILKFPILTQKAFAECLGVNQRTIQNWGTIRENDRMKLTEADSEPVEDESI